MRTIVRRPVVSFGLGVLVAGGLFAAGVAYGSGDVAQIHACEKKGNGSLYIADETGCKKGDAAVDWNVQGPPGQDGPPGPAGPPGPPGPTGTLESPNGLYSISVADSGIVLKGPGGTVKIDSGSLVLKGTVLLSLSAPIASFNGGCTSVMRQNGAGVVPSSSVFTC